MARQKQTPPGSSAAVDPVFILEWVGRRGYTRKPGIPSFNTVLKSKLPKPARASKKSRVR